MLPTIIRRTAQQNVPYVYTNPYKAKRLWPPDFSKLSPKHQFRLERRYKRRAKLKWERPRWTKAVKMVQMGSVVFVGVYGVLFLDWNQETWNKESRPFQGIRDWFWGMMGSILPSRDQVRRQEPNNASAPATSVDK
ncbi:hypothetical protein M430DRAFT_46028 [Amorphotheca resinae ATCC 22711]|uniref:Uncharacterized protein n=1 Tax=Amorphotheca resinae ATCC 22711 TaxID=857342 RepID=A0A2T3AP23_AMORE|nr:hypothetical protein M430DRAFT_46028 [Amorphotheca resinae ATCC 22711]PSS06674.1 hypothetical protein M430DRAFT_46028 [Amorphotheca resinae ATCC 22711]